MKKILLCDHPWIGLDIEQQLCDEAGFELVEAPANATLDQLLALGGDVVGIVTCWATVPRALIEASPHLKVVSRLGVGVDNIDLEAADDRGVVVTRVPDYCVEEVSDHVVAVVHNWARGIAFFDRSVRAGIWQPGSRDLRRIRELTIGIWGSGLNGIRTGEKFAALGCTVLFDDRHPDRVANFEAVPVETLLDRSDVLSLHIPLTPANVGILNAERLSRMKHGSLVVNTARGALINIDDLAVALDAGTIDAAALDVLPNEPVVPPAIAGRENVVITPHVAFSSIQAITELRHRTFDDHFRAQRGETPMHPVKTIASHEQ